MNGNSADLIIPGIWLGNRNASQDINFLKQNNITAVFNCTKDIPFPPLPLRFYRVPVDDNLQEDEIRNMELWSSEIVVKLMKEYNAGNNVLVHCAAGMQRSAAVMAMTLIALTNKKPDEVMDYIRSIRPIAFQPSANFKKSILGFDTYFKEAINE